jgi:hypothetical protein
MQELHLLLLPTLWGQPPLVQEEEEEEAKDFGQGLLPVFQG